MRAPFSWMLVAGGVFVAVSPSEAARPLTTEDAAPVEVRHFEIEAGVRYDDDRSSQHFEAPFSIAYGVHERFEVEVEFGGRIEQREKTVGQDSSVGGIGDLVLATKISVLDAERFWADHSLAAAIKLPTANHRRGLGSGRVDYDLAWVVTKEFDPLIIHFNAGYTIVGKGRRDDSSDIVYYGLAAEYQFKTIDFVAEVFADTPVKSRNDTAVVGAIGLRWKLTEEFALDAGCGTALRGDSPRFFATAGLTWTFGLPRKE